MASTHISPSPVTQGSRYVYLFGYPISHSVSPAFHGLIFSHLSLPWRYTPLPSCDVSDLSRVMQQEEFIGAAVTMPNKMAVLKLVHRMTEDARVIGAVNTIYVRETETPAGERTRCFIGTNTDWIGMTKALLRKNALLGSELQQRPAVVIGGGATCRSAIYALTKGLGARLVYIVNRSAEEVNDVITGLRNRGMWQDLIHLETVEQLQQLPNIPPVILGTVPDFPPKSTLEHQARDVIKALFNRFNHSRKQQSENTGIFLEMCNDPSPRTELVRLAEKAGWVIVNGIDVMSFQAIEQDVLWCERPIEELSLNAAASVIHGIIMARQNNSISK
jgi:quinate dehydrogenase